ncbi:hypothetical protein E4N62_17665 [Streptomyces sp. MNU76]|uniref:hypothetical protein n=1 Tax=Streptomyces sp. MNU76 TaxID=2560026 RepID=UPI001E29A54F|nr:hypothetical protein [Streptomyces sp. MNU76]MCC9706936.1 hypothetical protein [Streptomyces sp. MNU76]
MVSEPRPVTWGEAARMTVACSIVCALACPVLALLGEPQLPFTAPVVMLLAHWLWTRPPLLGPWRGRRAHRLPVVFVLVDHLRPRLGRLLADAAATEAGALVALVAFTSCSRLRNS